MISSEKTFWVLLQTICVGGLCVGVVVSNAEELNRSNAMAVVVPAAAAVTLASGIISMYLAEKE